MARIGLCKPYYAKYTNTDGVVAYSGGGLVGKAIDLSITADASDSNDLYADNAICESDKSFAGGKMTITVDDIEQKAAEDIMGIIAEEMTVGEETIKVLNYNDDANAPDLGFGAIVKRKHGGVIKWLALMLTKVKFNVPEDAFTTQGEKISWQTPKLEATVMRDDTEKHGWKKVCYCDTEAQAEAVIKSLLNIPTTPSP